MFKSCLPVSIQGTNFLLSATSINSVWVTRLKSSVVTKTFNPSQTKFANVTNILTEENPFIIGRHEKPKVDRTAEPIIKCKRAELNHYRNQKYEDLTKIPLASKGWRRTASKGDHFSILIHTKDFEVVSDKEPLTFRDAKLDEALINVLAKHGITEPSEIQSRAIPHVLEGKNCLIAAETGCGKTLAYLAPIIQQILHLKRTSKELDTINAPIGLIITPGRDLAEQIYEVASWFSSELDLDVQVLTGGRGKKKMLNAKFEPVDLMISSLGILSKFTTTRICSMRNIRHVILDEADTLLDDSFNELLLYFLRRFQFTSSSYRKDLGSQMVFASATMPTSLSQLLIDTVDLENVEQITTRGLHFVMPHVKQTFYRTNKSDKPSHLLKIAKEAQQRKLPTIIFSNKTPACDWINIFLNDNGIKCVNLHGDMPAELRNGRFKMFQDGEVNFISTTDLCARGLDTRRAKRVVNYDFPYFISDYIHRVGRIGRLGSPENCDVISLVTNNYLEVKLLQEMELSVRTKTSFHNVNSNIRRILQHRYEKNAKVVYEISDQLAP
ncbi:unnamed protein product [Bemisia tabaci]|uniref:RNA helicase n=1 Tax=Bemisia tabaci TaxID=7038 RepID=A0A9P0AKB0_BEMTA|nr:unnamed protein product [Bemisia tabaci]